MAKRIRDTCDGRSKHLSREQVLEAHRSDPSGKTLQKLLIAHGLAVPWRQMQIWERFIPLPAY